jgi:hypothetical protein
VDRFSQTDGPDIRAAGKWLQERRVTQVVENEQELVKTT